jgi:hypothetical protein
VEVFRPSGVTAESVRASYQQEIARRSARLESTDIENAIDAATSSVDGELADGSYVQKFRGKKLLRGTYSALGLANTSYEQFCYTLAIKGKSLNSISDCMLEIFDSLDSVVNQQWPRCSP